MGFGAWGASRGDDLPLVGHFATAAHQCPAGALTLKSEELPRWHPHPVRPRRPASFDDARRPQAEPVPSTLPSDTSVWSGLATALPQ